MNGRVYDPSIGRFLSPDVQVQFAGYTQSFNRYSYALNNPLSLTDPSGYGQPANEAHLINKSVGDDVDDDGWPVTVIGERPSRMPEHVRQQIRRDFAIAIYNRMVTGSDQNGRILIGMQTDVGAYYPAFVNAPLESKQQNLMAQQENNCQVPQQCAGNQLDDTAPHESTFNTAGFISTIASLSLATEKTVLTATGQRMPRLPLYYGMDIKAYDRAVTASKYFGYAGRALGAGSYAVSGTNYFKSVGSGDYRLGRKYGPCKLNCVTAH